MSGTEKLGGSELTLVDIEDLARWALEEHGLAERGWTFGWDRALRRVDVAIAARDASPCRDLSSSFRRIVKKGSTPSFTKLLTPSSERGGTRTSLACYRSDPRCLSGALL